MQKAVEFYCRDRPLDPYQHYPSPDPTTSKTFLYNNAKEVRAYQVRMALAAAQRNTLIVLPTGMGKTFIAAMVISNFQRWFPERQVIFFAPTRPLLKQQMNAIKAEIGSGDLSCEISGSIGKEHRIRLWREKKIIFATGQAVVHDIDDGTCHPSRFVLLVFDEAHRARGDYCYCQVVEKVLKKNIHCRIVGLTATPGETVMSVQQIISSLSISSIECDECEEYCHQRQIEKCIIPFQKEFLPVLRVLKELLQPLLTRLKNMNIIYHDEVDRVSKGLIATLIGPSRGKNSYQYVTRAARYLSLMEKLEEYSPTSFRRAIAEDCGRDLNIIGQLLEKIPLEDKKIEKLIELVEEELSMTSDSRIIVFCNYRSVVDIIVTILQDKGIKCAPFVGQGQSGMSKGQAKVQQQQVMQEFRKGFIRVIVTTCIGEEGLDIGEVDLIICFDILKSITRMIQRMGRTGRKKAGKVIFLVNEISRCSSRLDNISSGNVKSFLDGISPCLDFPPDVFPLVQDFEVVYRTLEYHDGAEIPKPVQQSCLLHDREKVELRKRYGERLSFRSLSLTESSIRRIQNTLVKSSAESQIMSFLHSTRPTPVSVVLTDIQKTFLIEESIDGADDGCPCNESDSFQIPYPTSPSGFVSRCSSSHCRFLTQSNDESSVPNSPTMLNRVIAYRSVFTYDG